MLSAPGLVAFGSFARSEYWSFDAVERLVPRSQFPVMLGSEIALGPMMVDKGVSRGSV